MSRPAFCCGNIGSTRAPTFGLNLVLLQAYTHINELCRFSIHTELSVVAKNDNGYDSQRNLDIVRGPRPPAFDQLDD